MGFGPCAKQPGQGTLELQEALCPPAFRSSGFVLWLAPSPWASLAPVLCPRGLWHGVPCDADGCLVPCYSRGCLPNPHGFLGLVAVGAVWCRPGCATCAASRVAWHRCKRGSETGLRHGSLNAFRGGRARLGQRKGARQCTISGGHAAVQGARVPICPRTWQSRR